MAPQIDLSGQHVEITEKLSLTNTGREHLKSFIYCLPEQHVQRLSYLAVCVGPHAASDWLLCLASGHACNLTLENRASVIPGDQKRRERALLQDGAQHNTAVACSVPCKRHCLCNLTYRLV